MATALKAHAASHPGRQRENNEDRLHVDASRGLFIVADGMGGHAAGERAAEIAIDAVRERLEQDRGTPAERLREAIGRANDVINRRAASNPDWEGMACVLTAAIIRDGRLTVGHVGDTRGYRIRGSELRKITRDHSPVGEREDRGEISELEAMRHPRRHEVFRDVGSSPRDASDVDLVEISEHPFDEDCALLLCTDGLTDLVPSETIGRLIREHAGDGARLVDRLVDAANEAGGTDNVSVIYVEGPAFAASARRPPGHAAVWPRVAGVLRSRPITLFGGVLLGVAAALIAALATDSIPDQVLRLGRPAGWTRTWQVGRGSSADGVTIAEVLGRAQPGDVVRVEPGIYREQVVMDRAVSLVSARSREAVIAPPLDAPRGWVALDVRKGASGRIAGFTITGEGSAAPGVGIRIGTTDTVVEDVEVRGAACVGIEIDRGTAPTIRAAYVHDNGAAGIVVADDATPSLLHSVVTRNGATGGDRVTSPCLAVTSRPAGLRLAASSRPLLAGNVIIRNAEIDVSGLTVEAVNELRRDNVIDTPALPDARGPARPGPPRRAEQAPKGLR